jgi:FtsP/CotA-like multicopper oxidase with cupredoxin domain
VQLDSFLHAPPDKTLSFVAEMDMDVPEGVEVVYVCPMHPEVVSEHAGSCPECGMKLLPTNVSSYVCPMHPEVTSDKPDRCPHCGMKLLPAQLVAQASSHGAQEHHHRHHGDRADGAPHHDTGHGGTEAHPQHEKRDDHGGATEDAPRHGHAHHRHAHDEAGGIEWEDDMVDVNRITTPANTRWKLIDRETGAVNHEIDWRFHVGDQIKLRLVNEMDSDHPMHHPFHIHGAGRFVVLARDGAREQNLVWKDTVLVRTGETVDILLDVTNPGVWMAHCHIAEHHESGMMFSFDVAPARD